MPIKNELLFQKVPRFLKRLFVQDELPWQALDRMARVMKDCRKKDEWPSGFAQIMDLPERVSSQRCGTIIPDGSVNIRTGRKFGGGEYSLFCGPVIFGKGITFRKGAVVVGPVSLVDKVLIGQGCRVTDSIILSRAYLSFGTRVSRSVIGYKARIGDGVGIEEESWTGREIIHRFKGKCFPSGRKTLGAFIGDRCWIGAGCVLGAGVILLPGTHLEAGTIVPQGSVLSGFVPMNSFR